MKQNFSLLGVWLFLSSDEAVTVCQVFFYKGELHIIPLSETQEQDDCEPSAACPTISQALRLLSTRSEEFLAAEPIRAAVYKRISGYVDDFIWFSVGLLLWYHTWQLQEFLFLHILLVLIGEEM